MFVDEVCVRGTVTHRLTVHKCTRAGIGSEILRCMTRWPLTNLSCVGTHRVRHYVSSSQHPQRWLEGRCSAVHQDRYS
ncbi:hypothetical protein E2C01_038494 [Portunus trituberculatus]|uniref:Uncharacterized protein n=1 Tax=Portunus trituberculatus TaxID=210409 RepID=A0A5B7FK99_PORTR|nr:hypothetical protein [Portunus trituberculatus]